MHRVLLCLVINNGEMLLQPVHHSSCLVQRNCLAIIHLKEFQLWTYLVCVQACVVAACSIHIRIFVLGCRVAVLADKAHTSASFLKQSKLDADK